MDSIDTKLLSLLQEDSKLSYAELGRSVGLAVSTVNDRLKKLHQGGAIRHYAAVLEPKAVGLDTCAFVEVLMSGPRHESAFISAMAELPQVQECHCVTGSFSYLLKVRVTDASQLEAFLRERIKSIEGVARTQTMIALSTSKETLAVAIPAATR